MPNKLKMRRLGPSRIAKKYGKNSYQVELLEDIGLSPVFNVADLVAYKGPIQNANHNLEKVTQEVENLHLFPT